MRASACASVYISVCVCVSVTRLVPALCAGDMRVCVRFTPSPRVVSYIVRVCVGGVVRACVSVCVTLLVLLLAPTPERRRRHTQYSPTSQKGSSRIDFYTKRTTKQIRACVHSLLAFERIYARLHERNPGMARLRDASAHRSQRFTGFTRVRCCDARPPPRIAECLSVCV